MSETEENFREEQVEPTKESSLLTKVLGWGTIVALLTGAYMYSDLSRLELRDEYNNRRAKIDSIYSSKVDSLNKLKSEELNSLREEYREKGLKGIDSY